MTEKKALSYPITIDQELLDFNQDALHLFTNHIEGHMGKWEYGPSLYNNDPAGGADLWTELARAEPSYYLTKADINLVQWAVRQDSFRNSLSDVEILIELGPGSSEVFRKKTLPILNAIPKLKRFVALDISQEFAETSARLATEGTNIDSQGISCDFTKPFQRSWEGTAALMVLGSTISNMACMAGESPFHKLTEFFRNIYQSMKKGDQLLVTFDTVRDPAEILAGYNSIAGLRHGINIAYRLKRDGIVGGSFDPRVWKYEPIWLEETAQCCHTIYPIFDQMIKIAGFSIRVPAAHRFITNNSYKYNPEIVTWAAQTAGFKQCQILFRNGMGLLIATF